MGFHPSGSGGATAFTGLSDVPGSYSGQDGLVPRVKATEDGLEFYDPSSSGDVVGPSSATDYAVVLFDGITGKLLRNSGIVANVTNDVAGMNTLTLKNTGLHLLDTDASHDLIVKPGSNLTADRTLTVTTGDADRTLSLGGDLIAVGAVNLAGAFSTAGGAYSLALTLAGNTALTLPTTGTVAVLATKLSAFAAPDAAVSMGSQLITNVANPVSATDGVNKAYADAIASGLLVKTSCRFASVANFSATYLAGVLTAVGFGAISIDGNTPSVNDRVLLKDQTDAKQNGIYVVTTVGNGGASAVLTRATDFDTDAEVLSGSYSFVTAGTVNAATGFILTTADPITLDTTSLSFTQFSAAANYIAGAGLTLTSLTFAIGAGTGITVNADSIEVDFTAVQAKSTLLTAWALYNTNGLVVQTAPNTFVGRSITAGTGIAVTNGDGNGGNPSIAVSITSLTEDVVPDTTVDYVMTYDTSAGTHKKTLLRNIKSGIAAFKQVGTAVMECWYSNQVTAAPPTVTTVATTPINTIRAFPWYSASQGTIDRIGLNVNVLAALGVVRVGIYKATSKTNLYPNELIVESGELSTASAGPKAGTISADLLGDTLYYFVFLFGIAAPIIRAAQNYAVADVLGYDSTLPANHNIGLTAALAYGALPATFPAGATMIPSTTNSYLGYVRYSA